MIKSLTPEFNTKFYTLISRLFRENYVGRIADWCKSHGILLTGHLMCESEVHNSLISSGDALAALRRFGLPVIDEVYTVTDSTETLILLDGRGLYVSTDPIPTEPFTLLPG